MRGSAEHALLLALRVGHRLHPRPLRRSTRARTAASSTSRGRDMSGMRYLTVQRPMNRRPLLIDENLGITARDANGCVTDPTAVEVYDPRAADALRDRGRARSEPRRRRCRCSPSGATARAAWSSPARRRDQPGVRRARAGTRRQYRKAPKVIFLAQSFGGLATRFLLSNPAARRVRHAAAQCRISITICPEDRAKMDYLRDRTVYALDARHPARGQLHVRVGPAAEGPHPRRHRQPRRHARRARTPSRDLVRTHRRRRRDRASAQPAGLVELARIELRRLDSLLDTPALRDMKLATMRALQPGPALARSRAPHGRLADRRARRARSSRSTRRSAARRAATCSTRRRSSRASRATAASARRRRDGSSARCSSPTCS